MPKILKMNVAIWLVHLHFQRLIQKGVISAPFTFLFVVVFGTIIIAMVRTSKRQALIQRLIALLKAGVKHRNQLQALGLPTHREEQFVYQTAVVLSLVKRNQYLHKRGTYRKRRSRFWKYLDVDHDEALRNREFQFHFRMSRDCFWQLVELLKGHEVFVRSCRDGRGQDPKPAQEQLLVLLKYFGSDGI